MLVGGLGWICLRLEFGEVLANGLFGIPGPLLNASQEFIFLTLFEEQVVIGELGPFLFQVAFDIVPLAFEF